ncbi:hypothetical protein EW093_06015 [Thiospirochaeta perfilievii]|uniref:GGDEF domain-containing protein n=1 Tax=Thiospirochaeta perfilievii TaxID=252967 RepID=A0A5C1Q864_9SPIO|nr:hypothetical protein [Thiospirochaeta perfilievii]QEN04273.1 hypothetical protein EW093_06015 [Thiospirochaeta perfilievii]
MKRIIARLYILIISVLILFGLIYLLNQVVVSRNEYINESTKISEETKNILETNWFKYKTFENQSLSDSLRKYMNEHQNIHSIIIYSKDKGLIKFNSKYNDRLFLINNLVPNDPTWKMRPEYSFSWWEKYKNNIISTPLQINERGFAFDLIYNVLNTEKVGKVFMDAFLMVLILLVLTIIVIIIFTLWKSKNSISEYDGSDFTTEPLEHNIPHSAPLSDVNKESDLDTSDDETDSLDDFDFSDGDELDNLDLNMGENDSEADDLDDFSFDMDEDDSEADDLDDFSIAMDEDDSEADDLDDFSLDIDEDDSEADDLDDFSLDIDEDDSEADDLDDFSLDMDEDDSEADDLDDFSLDMDEDDSEADDLDDFSLDIEEDSNETEEIDELDDFSLDIEEDNNETEEIEELDDFSLDMDEDNNETEEIDELDDFSLDIEEDNNETEEIDELDDFSLDIEEDDSEADDLDDLGELTDSIDDVEEDDELSTTYNLEDFSLEDEDNQDEGYDLKDFSLDDDELELSQDIIEEASDIDDLPELDIEDDLLENELASKSIKIRQASELAPEISSLLEKASVSDNDLSIAIIHLSSENYQEKYNLIEEHFDDNSSIFEVSKDKVAVAIKNTSSKVAAEDISKLIMKAKGMNLNLSVGISSMKDRRVGENRLLGEAIKAADMAKEQNKDMLTFMPDPKKYKDYIINS